MIYIIIGLIGLIATKDKVIEMMFSIAETTINLTKSLFSRKLTVVNAKDTRKI